jgi:hypothetical protein
MLQIRKAMWHLTLKPELFPQVIQEVREVAHT